MWRIGIATKWVLWRKEKQCCVSNFVCVVYISICKISCNIYTKRCLLKCHNHSNWIYQKMSIKRKCAIIEKVLVEQKKCILNENVSIDQKYSYWMKRYMLKGHNLSGINSSSYSFGGFGLGPVSSDTGLVEIVICVHFWTHVTIPMGPLEALDPNYPFIW